MPAIVNIIAVILVTILMTWMIYCIRAAERSSKIKTPAAEVKIDQDIQPLTFEKPAKRSLRKSEPYDVSDMNFTLMTQTIKHDVNDSVDVSREILGGTAPDRLAARLSTESITNNYSDEKVVDLNERRKSLVG